MITHRTILQEVWGPGYGTETRYLRVYASQPRHKLTEYPPRPGWSPSPAWVTASSTAGREPRVTVVRWLGDW